MVGTARRRAFARPHMGPLESSVLIGGLGFVYGSSGTRVGDFDPVFEFLASSVSFCSIGTILPSRPARMRCRRAQWRSRMARLRATASAARSVLDRREHDGMIECVGVVSTKSFCSHGRATARGAMGSVPPRSARSGIGFRQSMQLLTASPHIRSDRFGPYPNSACLRRGSHEDETHLRNGLLAGPRVARSSSIPR